jgi:23S rRNA (cytidine2498-2'-O)-methyltransferase
VDLAEELSLGKKAPSVRVLVPALLSAEGALPRRDGAIDLTFARQGFPLAASMREADPAALARACIDTLRPRLDPHEPWTLHAFVPDSDEGNRLAGDAAALQRAVQAGLAADPALGPQRSADGDHRPGGLLAQICLAAPDRALVGVVPFGEALSPFPGGRARMHDARGAPSRAAMKLEEALAFLGHGPEPGERCVDLGAAPGGWTWVLLERRARVTCVDPGKLAPDIARRKGVTQILGSAFDYEPREPVDWLLCDMAWRPLEVAALLAKWGRRRWARSLVANIKLPMKHKAEFLGRVRRVVEGGGWRDVRTRQLYHDRDEITLVAWRTP